MTESNETASTESYTAQMNNGTTYCVQGDESVTEAVVRAVSSEKGSHPSEMESLYSVVETDALNTLFESKVSGRPRMANGVVEFRYNECDIRVTHDGDVIITEGDAE